MKLQQLVLLVLCLLLQFALVSSPRALRDGVAKGNDPDYARPARKTADLPPPNRNCTCDHEIFCTPSSETSHPIPWVACVISILISFVPAKRVWRLHPQDEGDKQTLFWWFLIFNFSGYFLWNGYTLYCQLLDSIRVASLAGLVSSAVLLWKSYRSLPRYGDLRWYNIFSAVVLSTLCIASLRDHADIVGWCCLGVTVAAHFFRIGATDYTKFNSLLFCASFVGTFSGFLWLFHPDLCVAKHYKITSYVVSCFRGLEVFMWCTPKITKLLSKLEKRSRDD